MARRKLPLWLIVIAALIAILLPGGGAVAYFRNRKEEENAIRGALRLAAVRYGLVPEYLEAIAKVESAFRMNAVNNAGADGARGGAHGPTQITAKTFIAHGGKESEIPRLKTDPAFAADWTGRILQAHHKRRKLTTLADYVAAWNAGKDDADKNDNGELEELPETHMTRKHYLPRAKASLDYVRGARVA